MAEIQRFCPNCGHPVEPTDDFCPFCGKKLSDVDEHKMTGEKKKKREATESFSVDGRTVSNMSFVALGLGIAAFLVPYGGLVCAILAIVFGNQYRKQNSYANVGFILGIVACVVVVLYTIISIILFSGMMDGIKFIFGPGSGNKESTSAAIRLIKTALLRK